MERSRPVHAITHAILAWNTRKADVNNMADLATKLSYIPPTFLRDFLSPEEEEDIMSLNDLGEELVFFSVICSFSLCKLAKIAATSNSRFLAINAMASGAISG